MRKFLVVSGQVLLVLIGFALNNVTLVDYSEYRVIVPIAVVAFLGAIGITLVTWHQQPKSLRVFSILVVFVSIWQLQDAVLRRLPALFGFSYR